MRALEECQSELRLKFGPALAERIRALRSQWTQAEEAENAARIAAAFRALARQGEGLRPFAEFKDLLERELCGLVVTAHPTFALSREALSAARVMMEGADAGWEIEPPEIARLHPRRSPSLDEELALSEKAVTNIRRAIRRVLHQAVTAAAELYPEDWKTVTPLLITAASWVGFDLDGRRDIGWEKSLSFRYRCAQVGLQELQTFLAAIMKDADHPALYEVKEGLEVFAKCFAVGEAALAEATEQQGFATLNRLAMARRADKEAAMAAIDGALDQLMTSDLPQASLTWVAVFRAEWRAMGLGLSHIHFRLNAEQVHNAIRSEIDLDRRPDRSASRRHYLAAINQLLEGVEPVNVHYGTLAAEKTTAKRVFMLAAQFEKHFDGRTPIRLLVAESDTPFTLLTALYYARLFGVSDHVEISPLFETAVGLKRGDRVIAELLDNDDFVRYIRAQGRFAVQLGFSDSGRYIGQPAAGLAIERFKLRLIRLWRDRGLEDVQLLFFDTHGESIGRGAHPGSLTDRFLYTHPPKVRAALEGWAAPHKHEVSFQGGDGYLWFLTEKSAFATLADFLAARLASYPGDADPFYEERGWSLDFFLQLTEFQDGLRAHPGYVRLLDSMGANLLFPLGSRATKRQGRKSAERLEEVGQIRAIPHNAMLQQLGYMANSLGGLGTAIARTPEQFHAMLAASPRLQGIMAMMDAARRRSDISWLTAYVGLMNPDGWIDLAEEETDPEKRDAMLRLSSHLEDAFDHQAIGAVLRVLRRDAAELADALSPGEASEDLRALHATRLELMRFVYLKAMEVPRFSTRMDVSVAEVITQILHLDVPEAVAALKAIFPAAPVSIPDTSYGEEATYTLGRGDGYAEEHERIFDPMLEAHGLMRQVSALIALKIGAIG